MNMKNLDNLLQSIPEATRKSEGLKLDFALGLVRLLEKNQIAYGDYAKSVGVSPAYISKVLRGDTNVTIETMVKLATGAKGDVHIRVTDTGKNFCWAGKHNGRRASAIASQSSYRSRAVFRASSYKEIGDKFILADGAA
jgi:transcriptional regulator with XRE-family HTH domain